MTQKVFWKLKGFSSFPCTALCYFLCRGWVGSKICHSLNQMPWNDFERTHTFLQRKFWIELPRGSQDQLFTLFPTQYNDSFSPIKILCHCLDGVPLCVQVLVTSGGKADGGGWGGDWGWCIFSYLCLYKFTLPNLFHPSDDVVSLPGLCWWLFLCPILKGFMLYFPNSVSSYMQHPLSPLWCCLYRLLLRRRVGVVLVCQPLLTPLMGDKSMIHIPAQR